MRLITFIGIVVCLFSASIMAENIAAADIKTLVMGTVSLDQGEKEYQSLKQRVDLIAQKMQKEGIKNSSVYFTQTIDEMTVAIKTGKVNWVSGDLLTILILANKTRAEVFLGEKGNAERQSSVFFVTKKSPIKSIDNIEKKIVLFEKTKTGNGYFIPFYTLTRQGYMPREYAKTDTSMGAGKQRIYYRFEKNKKDLITAVSENILNIGVLSQQDYAVIKKNTKQEFRAIYETIKYPSTLELIVPDQDLSIKNKLQDLLQLHNSETNKPMKIEQGHEKRFEQFLADGKDGYIFLKNILKHGTVPLGVDHKIEKKY